MLTGGLKTEQVNFSVFSADGLADRLKPKPVKAEDVRGTYAFERFETMPSDADSRIFRAVYTVTPKEYEVAYAFENGTRTGSHAGAELPRSVKALLPAKEKKAYGAEVTAAALSTASVEEADGVWAFQGFTPQGTQTLDEH